MLVNVVAREEDAFPVLRRLLTDNHEDRRAAAAAGAAGAAAGPQPGAHRRAHPARRARRVRPPLRADRRPARRLRAQPAAGALRAGGASTCSTRRRDDLRARRRLGRRGGARGAAPGPDGPAARGPRRGDRGDEGRRHRVRRADGAARGGHLAAAAAPSCWRRRTRSTGRRHPWLPEDALSRSRSSARCTSRAMGFTDFVGRYQLARSEGLVLRYLTDAYRTLRQTVPDDAPHRPSSTTSSSGWARPCARPTPRCSTSGRR